MSTSPTSSSCCSPDANATPTATTMTSGNVRESVAEYYGKVLKATADLKTNACCTGGSPPKKIRDILKLIHTDVSDKYYGCGLVIPEHLQGTRILDLGSGSGRDCYILSHLVGPTGSVIGIDMTKEQVDVASKYVDYHTEKFGFQKPNIQFQVGYIEDLSSIASDSVDIVISNCVLNLSPDKGAVLKEAHRVLVHGGEMYFSDVYSDRRIPPQLAADKVLYGECLSGALYWNDFLGLAKAAGFKDPRLLEDAPISIQNGAIEAKVGNIKFFSATYRLFKLEGLEAACEDYGQAVVYKGGMEGSEHSFRLDGHHDFPTGKVMPVCGNTAMMLMLTRFAPFFQLVGQPLMDHSLHYGIFPDCGTAIPFSSAKKTKGDSAAKASSCC